MRVVHLTSAHPRDDVRIFHKMCVSLSREYEVALVVADGLGDSIVNGVNIHDVGAYGRRWERIFKTTQKVFSAATNLKGDLYHLHDPELLPIGLKLTRAGKHVIFDSHEDVPKQMLAKPYLNKPTLWAISKVLGAYENWVCAQLSGVIAATPFIRDKFSRVNSRVVDINNFPMLDELASDIDWTEKRSEVCYVGGIGKIRGIRELIAALALLKSGARLNLCGRFNDGALEQFVKELPGWGRVNEYGYVDRQGVRDVLGRSVAGLVNLHPVVNYLDALPVKMFEYMAAGIPAICSDFPLWREIVVGSDCGLCVDPLKPQAIAEAVDYLMGHPEEAKRMGENGRRAVIEKYNWAIEERKLLDFYQEILS